MVQSVFYLDEPDAVIHIDEHDDLFILVFREINEDYLIPEKLIFEDLLFGNHSIYRPFERPGYAYKVIARSPEIDIPYTFLVSQCILIFDAKLIYDRNISVVDACS